MTKRIIFFISFLFFISCTNKQDKIAERNNLIDSTIFVFEKNLLKNKINKHLEKNSLNGVISVVDSKNTLYENINGKENFKNNSPLKKTSTFAIGSISKQITAVLVLQLVEKNKILLTDKASLYLSDLQNVYSNITIHQLLNHTSGINDFGDNLLFKSGQGFSYSNKGYYLLEKILEEIHRKSYSQIVEDLFLKLKMKHSTTAINENIPNFAGANIGVIGNSKSVDNMPKRLVSKSISIAAGGIISTIEDLHLWNFALHNHKILNQDLYKKMVIKSAKRDHPILGEVGYGYGIMMDDKVFPSLFHTGYVKGSASLLLYYPDSSTSVVVLSNLAEESKGMKYIFSTHTAIKEIADDLQISILATKKTMYSSLELE